MDEALRRREREARAGTGGAAARLEAARGLLRAGRGDELWALLGEARYDRDARALLGLLPAWTHPDGDAGRTRWVDLAPLRGPPRVHWRVELGLQDPRRLLASPLGVVVVGGARQWTLHDPDTGQWEEFHPRLLALRGEPLAWLGSRLLLRRGRDLDLQELPDAVGDRAGPHGLVEVRGGVVGLHDDAGALVVEALPARVRAWRWREGAPPEQVWERARAPWQELRPHELGLGTGLVLVPRAGGDSVLALDLATGHEQFAAGRTAALADAAGLVVAGPRGQVLGLDPDGLVRWTAPGLVPLALGPDVVLAWGEAIDLLLLERASGRLLGRLDHRADGVALARDVVYWWRQGPGARVGAVTRDGARLWELSLAGDEPRWVAPLPRRLLVLSGSALVCLGEA